MRDKLDYFFIDYDLIPMLFQENYLTTYAGKKSASQSQEETLNMAQAADLIVQGDCINKRVRAHQQWSLLPEQGMYGVVIPSSLLGSSFMPYAKFPEWMGKHSSTGRQKRMVKELSQQIGVHVSGSMSAIKNDYAPALLSLVLHSYSRDDKQGMEQVLQILDNYSITIDQLKEHLVDIQYNPKKVDFFKKVSTSNKSYLTRIYNSAHQSSLKGLRKKAVVTLEEEVLPP